MVDVLPASDVRRADALVGTQVTTRSMLGSVVYETGGLLVDYGWLRILGSGHPRLDRPIHEWNQLRFEHEGNGTNRYYLIADDVVGGLYALNGGEFPGATGNVHYFAPDTLHWEDLSMGYADFISWALKGDLESYYASFRWPGWCTEVTMLQGSQSMLVYPFLWSEGSPTGERSRKPVPTEELIALQFEVRRQLASKDS